MASPVLRFEFSPSPAAIRRASRAVAHKMRPAFIDDLVRAGYADDLASMIRSRTQTRGFGTKGTFKEYAPFTKLVRRLIYGVGEAVDLTVSGRMLNAMKGRRARDGVEVYFEGMHHSGVSNEVLAHWHEHGTAARGKVFLSKKGGTWRLVGIPGERVQPGIPARPFFGLTRGESVMATSVAATLFQSLTLPRLVREWEDSRWI